MEIDLTPATTIAVKDLDNNIHHINKDDITDISSVFQDMTGAGKEDLRAANRGHDTIAVVNLIKSNGSTFNFSLYDVTNQATWDPATQAGVQQAVADIQASL